MGTEIGCHLNTKSAKVHVNETINNVKTDVILITIIYLELYVADIFWAFYIPLYHLIQTGTTVGVHSWTSPQLVLPLTRPLLPSATRFGSKTAEPSSVRSSAACRKSSFRSRRKPQEKEEARRRMQLPPQRSFLTPNSLLPPPPPLLWRQRVLGSVPNPWTSN